LLWGLLVLSVIKGMFYIASAWVQPAPAAEPPATEVVRTTKGALNTTIKAKDELIIRAR
jgi:hypothetical protein